MPGQAGADGNYAMRANIRGDHTSGTGNVQVDNRSQSNESSPRSTMQRRNLIYKNVRNYNNLYDK